MAKCLMLMGCTELDRLWAAYDEALRAYIESVDAMTSFNVHARHSSFQEAAAAAVDCKDAVGRCRDAIRAHCEGHGCCDIGPRPLPEPDTREKQSEPFNWFNEDGR